MRFERNVTNRSLYLCCVAELTFYLIVLSLFLIYRNKLQESLPIEFSIMSVVIFLMIRILFEYIRLVIKRKMDSNFAYTINLKDGKVVITDDYGETKQIGREFVIVGKFAGEYKILLREGEKPGVIIPYNVKVLKCLKEINPNCMEKRLKKL